ncbi:MAG: SWIM zinc finger family protein, partial [Planctomycetaceae bacterium]
MARTSTTIGEFESLTWDDLHEWVGSAVLKRGRGYRSHVSGLSRTEDGRLVAWVHGTERYATSVWVEDGEIRSDCTCPYA